MEGGEHLLAPLEKIAEGGVAEVDHAPFSQSLRRKMEELS